MNDYQIVVSFKAADDESAIGVMEYMDADLPAAGLEGVDIDSVATTLPKRLVPANWVLVKYPTDDDGPADDDSFEVVP